MENPKAKPEIPLPKTREEMQLEAMHIQGLLEVAYGYDLNSNYESLMTILSIALEHAERLNLALDAVNKPEVMA